MEVRGEQEGDRAREGSCEGMRGAHEEEAIINLKLGVHVCFSSNLMRASMNHIMNEYGYMPTARPCAGAVGVVCAWTIDGGLTTLITSSPPSRAQCHSQDMGVMFVLENEDQV